MSSLPIPDLSLSGPYFNADGTPNVAGLQLLRVVNAIKERVGGIVSDGVSRAEVTATGGSTDTLDDWMASLATVVAGLAAHLADMTDAHDASAISYAGGTGISATDVEAAIDELATEKLDASSYTAADVLAKLLTVAGAGSGLDADLLDGSSSAAFGQLSAANTWTAANTFSQGAAASTPSGRFVNTTDSANVQALRIAGDRATPANNDVVYASFELSSGAGTQRESGRISSELWIVTDGAEYGAMLFGVMSAGALANVAYLNPFEFSPNFSGGLLLGSAGRPWLGAHLSLGATLNFNNGNVVVTHSSGALEVTTGAFAARVLTSSETGGTLTSASRNRRVALASAPTLPSSGMTAGDFILLDPGGTARVVTRPGSHTMYVRDTDVASDTTYAHNVALAIYHGSSKWTLHGMP